MNARTLSLAFATRSARSRESLTFVVLACALCAVVLLAVGVGAVGIRPFQALAILASQLGIRLPIEFDTQQQAVLLAIRLPRVVLGVMVGAGLAVAGAALQGLFRNPLADPALIGVSSGAAFAAIGVIVLGEIVLGTLSATLRLLALPVAAFAGGLVVTLIVHALAQTEGRTVVATMLLAGVAVSALAGAGTGLLTFLADDVQLRNITFWSLGSLGGATWTVVLVIAPFILLPLAYLPRVAKELNALLLGEREAAHLGINTERTKRRIIVLAAMAVGASVAVCGIIGFVGLVVPHLLRLSFGADHRTLLPGSALLGASLLLLADVLARTVVIPAELPIGIITALVGAPFFLWLLLRDKRGKGF